MFSSPSVAYTLEKDMWVARIHLHNYICSRRRRIKCYKAPNTIYKNEHKMDQRFNIRPETMKLLEEKLRQELYYIRFSNGS